MKISSLKQHFITKRSALTDKPHTFNIWFTDDQWQRIQSLAAAGAAAREEIEEILPDHSPSEKEFLLTGTTQSERALSETPFTSAQAEEMLRRYPPKTV